MIEVYGNLWDYTSDARVITTNGFIKHDGSCVMGRGCAKEAATRYPQFPSVLGARIKQNGNVVMGFTFGNDELITFPVKGVGEKCCPNKSNVVSHMQKQFKADQWVPGWALKANMGIIRHSCEQLMHYVHNHNYSRVVMPRPGCGAGELLWSEVKMVLESYLDDRIHVITFKKDHV
jgi:hypothetical protein